MSVGMLNPVRTKVRLPECTDFARICSPFRSVCFPYFPEWSRSVLLESLILLEILVPR
jgi:hypothetical protein